MGYTTVAEFRSWTGLQDNELNNSQVQDYLNRAYNQIKRDAFVYNREEYISRDEHGYYFPKLKYFADADADGSITANDINIREYNPTYNISSAVDSSDVTAIDEYNTYFTLNNSSYTASSQIRVSYWVANRPNSELINELEELSICWAAHEAFKYVKTKRLKSGIVSFSLGKLNVTRTEEDYEHMVDQWRKRYMHLITWIKPSRFRKAAEGRRQRASKGRQLIAHTEGGTAVVSSFGNMGSRY